MTFYRFPKPETLKSWLSQTPAGFVFSLKANRRITHIKKLKNTGNDVSYFYNLARTLGEKLGCILFQLPPSVTRDDSLLKDFLSFLSPEFCNVIEFRQPDWFSPAVFDLLRTYRVTACSVSSALMPSKPVVTSEAAYFRFHGLTGGYRYEYRENELEAWADRIRSLDCERILIYFNNDYQARAVKNAKQLAGLLTDTV